MTSERIEELRRVAEAASRRELGAWAKLTDGDLPGRIMALLAELERLRRESNEYRESAAEWKAEAESAEAELRAAQARNADLARQLMEASEERAKSVNAIAVLKSVEWASEGYWCPSCGQMEDEGHASDCALAAALSSAPANPYAAVVEAARSDYEGAKSSCDVRRERGDCEAWTERGLTCTDCPLEWFEDTPDALALLERSESEK